MSTKVEQKGASSQRLKDELKELKSKKGKNQESSRIHEIAKQLAAEKEWSSAIEAIQLITDEKERNILISDTIEGYLLPAKEIDQAKKFAKLLTPTPEMEPFVWIRIALASKDPEQALKLAKQLPSPISRNFAFIHIMEYYLSNKEKSKIDELRKQMLENLKTIYDHKSRSFILRELAISLFYAYGEKEQAKEIAKLIPDEDMRSKVLKKVEATK
ncbi:putative uncharacterized protein [Parachlamydia acanthamoebae UV-7]|jgi:thioredoxin-like negative regulator of GroEL|uniref:Uncharacterized protein n=2 Tax=Parachlamydia acanthamoebae TaxID=83552 RepID=F8KZK0_PARAV|nr:hypothetical protein [Parachlamydia acanthamoebae]EFB41774.1 hypothetical protein pah_c022o049 [Parachlamydia acanthamoebae str. Hall's coccus]KIA77929.1 hypothetical protein DB43_FJ00070 [Parachlamydia acanthamoebae]CCB86340.1 putative uncharacterized protein [Parachlamydia acanthamoebae UV-7]